MKKTLIVAFALSLAVGQAAQACNSVSCLGGTNNGAGPITNGGGSAKAGGGKAVSGGGKAVPTGGTKAVPKG